jgi:hypothetical protein
MPKSRNDHGQGGKMKLKSPFVKILLRNIKNTKKKSLIIIGVHNGNLIKELGNYFKKVNSYYEFLKIKGFKRKNILIKKEPFSKTFKRFKDFDVIVIMNEMHHLPDIQQMQIYSNLKKNQELILIEGLNKGTFENFYVLFQDCKPLCALAKEIMNKFVRERAIKIEKKIIFKPIYYFKNKNDLKKHIKFELPDHFKFGKKDFEKKIKKIRFPIKLYETENFYKIKKFKK